MEHQSPVQFFETTHRYFLKKNGRELVAVSRILELAGILSYAKVPFEIRERAGVMGDYVHDVARLYGRQTLLVEELDDQLIGYYEAVKSFFAKRVKKILFTEAIVYNGTLGYAGTLDIAYQDHDNRVCVDDYKHGILQPGFKLQLAAYKDAFEKNHKIRVDERATVRLNANGVFDEKKDRIVYTERQDFHDFVSAVGVAYFKIRNKVN